MSPGGYSRLLLYFAASVTPFADDLHGERTAQCWNAHAALAGEDMAFCIAK
jgi:hypothetical protein